MHRSVCSAALACALLLLTATTLASPSSRDLDSHKASESISYVPLPKKEEPQPKPTPKPAPKPASVVKESKGDMGMPKLKSPPEYLGEARVAFAYHQPDFAKISYGKGEAIPVYKLESGKLPTIITHIGLEKKPGSKKPFEAAHWSVFPSDAKGTAMNERVQMKCSSGVCQFYDGVESILINHSFLWGTELHQSSFKNRLVNFDDGVWVLYGRTQESPALYDFSIATLLFSPLGSSLEFIKSMIAKKILTKKMTVYGNGAYLRVIVFNPQVFEVTPALLSDKPLFDKLLFDKFMLLLANDLILFSKGK